VSYVPKFCACCGDEIAQCNQSGYCSRTEDCRNQRQRETNPYRKSTLARYVGDTCKICGGPITSWNKTGSCSRTPECKKYTHKAFQLKYKLECFNAYGGAKCACCGETRLYFLTLDHVNGDGALDRAGGRDTGMSGNKTYNRLRSLGYPDRERYQVLCFNCNCAKGVNSVCPCSLERKDEDPE
jgi:hypothetical protein